MQRAPAEPDVVLAYLQLERAAGILQACRTPAACREVALLADPVPTWWVLVRYLIDRDDPRFPDRTLLEQVAWWLEERVLSVWRSGSERPLSNPHADVLGSYSSWVADSSGTACLSIDDAVTYVALLKGMEGAARLVDDVTDAWMESVMDLLGDVWPDELPLVPFGEPHASAVRARIEGWVERALTGTDDPAVAALPPAVPVPSWGTRVLSRPSPAPTSRGLETGPGPVTTGLDDAIRQFYGDGDLPAFGGVGAVLHRDPYARVRAAVADRWPLEDVTDPNSDVSFVLALVDHPEAATVRLSMVGRYACVLGPTGRPVEDAGPAELVAAAGFEVLRRDVLEQPVSLWAGTYEGTVWEFLFEFDRGLPWDRGEPW